MSPTLEAAFQQASQDVQQLDERPSIENLLKLYALYKQATEGDVQGERPGMMDMKGRAKFDAWAGLQGLSAQDAMQDYVDLVESLK
ncbi:MAG: acyl-CoA-binding protein [Betaproteobacteria bacterium]|jgi:diazepam-binding inhibitor (GABA receptor modulator, acyl-CoA-binding protein)|nr:acyl-CoA-binding protein [Betaproteobacteria bacterium]NBT09478.1 acyl-CoA-binding protein [Betaproteobacteria bacterium]NBU49550.1 acyl-CoA-binding protein [Betaproteobacteria bacterium]NBX95955.1 acyl-CoA-binding protein [Betaproteobacteria bacterium]